MRFLQLIFKGVSNDERPPHSVYVDAFYIDRHEETNAEYKKFIDANPEWQKDRIDPRFHDSTYLRLWTASDYPPEKADYPVNYISWYAAMAYTQWTGKRLPTEAEWEKAARGGVLGTPETIAPTDANHGRYINNTTPVGAYAPNGYGLYDMLGNVWEWCLDEYDANFYENAPGVNPSPVAVLKMSSIISEISRRIASSGADAGQTTPCSCGWRTEMRVFRGTPASSVDSGASRHCPINSLWAAVIRTVKLKFGSKIDLRRVRRIVKIG